MKTNAAKGHPTPRPRHVEEMNFSDKPFQRPQDIVVVIFAFFKTFWEINRLNLFESTQHRTGKRVKIIINDDNYFDALKAISSLVVEVGYKGLVICIDEMINLMRIAQTSSRKNNYEQLLRILNDLLQGSCSHMAVMLSGTPDFLTDERKGLYTYEALKSRLQENEFLEDGFFDPSHPVIRLKPLTSEEIFNLVCRVRDIYDSSDEILNKGDDQLVADYLAHCRSKLGSQLFTSPRNVIRGYLNLRDVIEGNPSSNASELLRSSEIEPDLDPDVHLNLGDVADNDLVDFQLNS